MAKITPKNPLGRGPSLRGGFYSYTRLGQVRAAGWPPHRGPPKTEPHKKTIRLFREACEAAKRTDPYIQASIARALTGSAYYTRDILFAMWYGRIGDLQLTNGEVYRAMPTRVNISNLLDNLGWKPGSMLYRTTEEWAVIPPGAAGNVLRFTGLAEVPAWGPPGPAGTPVSTLAHRTNNDTANTTFPKIAAFQATAIDDAGAWSGTNPTRLTIPSGVTRAQITARATLTSDGAARGFFITLNKNGVAGEFIGRPLLNIRQSATGFTNNSFVIQSPWLPVTPGDYFELSVNASATYSAAYLENTWAEISVA